MADKDLKTQEHEHQRFVVRAICTDCGAELTKTILNKADVETQQMTDLPDREAMTLVGMPLWLHI